MNAVCVITYLTTEPPYQNVIVKYDNVKSTNYPEIINVSNNFFTFALTPEGFAWIVGNQLILKLLNRHSMGYDVCYTVEQNFYNNTTVSYNAIMSYMEL